MIKIKNDENTILIAGFVLIIFVIIFTIFRNTLFLNSSKNKFQDNSQNNKIEIAPSYATISANDLNKKIIGIGKKENIALLDIRPFESYINEHIIDAINITIDEFPVGSKINKQSLIVIISKDGTDENISIAIEKLKKENCQNIIVLAGGMTAWDQLVGSAVSYGDPKSFIDQSKVSYLDPASLNDALSQKVPVFIVDVRSGDEFAKNHIDGAKNIPMEELEKRRSEITEKRVVVVGANELQEFQASVQMHDMLTITPFVMRTAMPGWQEKGFPTVK